MYKSADCGRKEDKPACVILFRKTIHSVTNIVGRVVEYTFFRVKEMLLLTEALMKKEERELRELLPRSALLHNCLVLAISKVGHIDIMSKVRTWHMMFCVYLVLCFSIHSFPFLLQNCPILVVFKEVSHISNFAFIVKRRTEWIVSSGSLAAVCLSAMTRASSTGTSFSFLIELKLQRKGKRIS